MKGETVDELVGFARAMRRMAAPVDAGLNGAAARYLRHRRRRQRHLQYLDRRGVRGGRRRRARGQARQPLDLEPAAAAPTCWKRWASSIALTPEQSARAIREVGIGFLFAPAVHTAMKHAQPVRVELKMRTVFNLLGPLTNPAGATAQLVGAPSEQAAELMAGALAALGPASAASWCTARTVWTRSPPPARRSPSKFATAQVERRTLEPADFGVAAAEPEDLNGGDPEPNLRDRATASSAARTVPGATSCW